MDPIVKQIIKILISKTQNSVIQDKNQKKEKSTFIFLILKLHCQQNLLMLYRHLKTSQVKCNFCLQWMSLLSDIKFNINVCDNCLHKGSQQNALKAVSPAGQIYQLYVVRQNSKLDALSNQEAVQILFEDIQQNNTLSSPEIKKDFFSQIDEQKNSQIMDIMAKWSILSSFLRQKDSLSTEEIKYLKILISQKAAHLKRINCEFNVSVKTPQIVTNQPSQYKNQLKQLKITLLKQNYIPDSIPNFLNVQISPKIKDKQNIQVLSKNYLKGKQNPSRLKDKLKFKSPSKIGLKEQDLNIVQRSHCNLSELKQNNQTLGKRVTTSLFNDYTSLGSSCLKGSSFLAQGSSRSAFGSSVFSTLTKQLNSEQIKKFQQIKSKILKYLQKNYDSQSLGRLMLSIVFEAYENTSILGKSLQLISYNLDYTDFRCYLEAFDWTGIEVLKLVKTKLSDEQLKTLVDFIIANDLPIKALVLTSNKLTETSIEYLAEQELCSVKQIYLGKNRITKGKVRAQIIALQNKYSLYM